MFDIISIGDATLDTFINLESVKVIKRKDRAGKYLCLNYACKTPIYSLE